LPTPGKIVSDTENAKLGTHELLLSNGVKVILKPTDFQNNQILMSARRFGGQSLYGDQDIFNARYANAVVGVMGLHEFSPIEVKKILAGRLVSVGNHLDSFTEGFDASASSADVEQLFQILDLRFASPRKDPALFQAFISNSQERAKNTLSNPNAVFSEALISTLYSKNPRVPNVPKPEDFAKVNLERAATIYQERFGSAKDFVFTIVGSFDIEKIKPLIATYIASLPNSDIVTSYKDLGIRPVNGVVKKEVFSGSEPKSQVNMIFTGNTEYSKTERNRFSALIDVLNIKITDVLREKLTLIYSGGINGAFERAPYTHYRIGISLPCKPENVDQVAAAMLAEIEKIKENGPEQGDLEKVRQNWSKQQQIDMRTNQYWFGSLQDAALYRTDPEEILEAEKRIQALDQAGIQAAAKKYFNTQNYVQVVLYPEKK
jgi:zinc protease